MYEAIRQETGHSKDLIQEVLSVEDPCFHPLDTGGESFAVYANQNAYILCWVFSRGLPRKFNLRNFRNSPDL